MKNTDFSQPVVLAGLTQNLLFKRKAAEDSRQDAFHEPKKQISKQIMTRLQT